MREYSREVTPKEVEAIIAAMHRVGGYSHLDTRSFEIEVGWIIQQVPRTRTGNISWRYLPLGRRLFDCLCEAQNWRCCYCGVRTLEAKTKDETASLEHVIPKSRGGADHPDNFAMACLKCNGERGSFLGLFLSTPPPQSR